MKTICTAVLALFLLSAPATAQPVLFDFDNAPLHTGLPQDLTVDGITAHLTATGQGFSIQWANTLGFTPVGFSGYCVYPSSVFAADLIVDFSQPLTDFSILYAPEEYACDSSACMRVTVYMNSVYVGTNTISAQAGTWPSETLSISSAQSFNRVVVHYDAPPPTGGDWGPIFMADNMTVTPASTVSVDAAAAPPAPVPVIAPNPFGAETSVRFSAAAGGPLSVAVFDVQGRLVRTLLTGTNVNPGERGISWDGRDDSGRDAGSGVYVCRVQMGARVSTARMILLRAD